VPDQPLREYDPARRRIMLIEVAIVLGIAVVPDIVNSGLVLFNTPPPLDSVLWQSLGLVDRSVRVGLAVLFIMWRSGTAWKEFGIVPVRWTRDPLIGIGLSLLCTAMFWASTSGFSADPFGFRAVPADEFQLAAPSDAFDWSLIVTVAILNGFTEELATRAFLIPRLERLTGSTAAALIATTILIASYHAYQGPWGMYNALLCGLMSGLYFIAARRVWPIVFAHMIDDIAPFAF
jgi:membrane protease YdiL (CAAX protease family)